MLLKVDEFNFSVYIPKVVDGYQSKHNGITGILCIPDFCVVHGNGYYFPTEIERKYLRKEYRIKSNAKLRPR